MEMEDFEADRDLEAWREAIEVAKLFRFSVMAQGTLYFCNTVRSESVGPKRSLLVLEDAWVYDRALPVRLVPKIEVVAIEYSIVSLPEPTVDVGR